MSLKLLNSKQGEKYYIFCYSHTLNCTHIIPHIVPIFKSNELYLYRNISSLKAHLHVEHL